jgi:hypothetical protein
MEARNQLRCRPYWRTLKDNRGNVQAGAAAKGYGYGSGQLIDLPAPSR